MSTKTGINGKRKKKYINTYTLMSTLLKKKKREREKRNSPVVSGNPTELKEEALMPGLLLLYELTMLDRRHQESQEWSENKVEGETWRLQRG